MLLFSAMTSFCYISNCDIIPKFRPLYNNIMESKFRYDVTITNIMLYAGVCIYMV